jgi:hypothetical protein
MYKETDEQGELLASEVRAEIERLGLGGLTTRYIPDRNVVRISWPHLDSADAEEGVDFPASRQWAERISQFLKSYARLKATSAGRNGAEP